MSLKMLRHLVALSAMFLITMSTNKHGVANAYTFRPPLPGAPAAIKCARCTRSIGPGDVYLEAMNQLWHPQCLTCAACNKPLPEGAFIMDEQSQKPFCNPCFIHHHAERCGVCAKPLTGQCLTTFHWGDKYCVEHEQMEKCYCCGRPVCNTLTGGGVRYRDGRLVCNICMTQASPVDDQETAMQLLYTVWNDLSGMGFDLGPIENMPPLRLVDAQATEGVDGTSILSTQKFYGREVGRSTEVLVLHSLPRTHMGSVIAHELGHFLIHQWGFPDLPDQVEEGLCELLACTWLTSQAGDPYAEYHYRLKLTNQDPIYGEGLRAALTAVGGNHEFSVQLFDFVRQHGHLPKTVGPR